VSKAYLEALEELDFAEGEVRVRGAVLVAERVELGEGEFSEVRFWNLVVDVVLVSRPDVLLVLQQCVNRRRVLRKVLQDREQLLQRRPVWHLVQVHALQDCLAQLRDREWQTPVRRFYQADLRLGRHLLQVGLGQSGLQGGLATGGLVG
jgi:hypothetical protein